MNISDILGGEKFFASIVDEFDSEPSKIETDDLFDSREFDEEFSDGVFETESADGGDFEIDDDDDEIFYDGGAGKNMDDVSSIINDILDNYYSRLI